MGKNNKKFTTYFFIIFAVVLIGIATYNLICDPFSVFVDTTEDAIKNKKVMPNERFIKMKYILKNTDKYDSYLIGSCTSNFMNLDNVPYGKWYNLTFTNNTISEMENSLKMLVKNNVKVERVLAQIGETSLKLPEDEHQKVCAHLLNYCSYPDGAKETIVFYARYLTYFPLVNPAKFDKWIDGSKNNIFKGGSFIDELPETEADMLESRAESFENDNFGIYEAPYNPQSFEHLREMKRICDENNIEFELFIIPEYISRYKELDIKAFNDAKRKIVEITPFYDFTGINKIALDKKYWCDPIHVNDWGSKLMVERIFFQDKSKAPSLKNYGTYVTKENIEGYARQTEKEFVEYNKTEK